MMEHASGTTVSIVVLGRRIKQMEGGAEVIRSPLSSRTPTAGLTSAAETVVVDAGVDADDATGNDGVDVVLVSPLVHIIEQLVGFTECVSFSATAVVAVDSRILSVGMALLGAQPDMAGVGDAEPLARSS